MNKINTIKYLKNHCFDEPESVKEWGELSYEEHMRVARILDEDNWGTAAGIVEAQNDEPECMSPFVSFRYLAFGEGDEESLDEFLEKIHPTYDVQFDDDNDSNSKGWAEDYDVCKDYIERYNGTDESYFKDYKGGTVSIICNGTGETVYSEEIK